MIFTKMLLSFNNKGKFNIFWKNKFSPCNYKNMLWLIVNNEVIIDFSVCRLKVITSSILLNLLFFSGYINWGYEDIF